MMMVKQISDKKDVEPIDLLQAFEIIVEMAKGSSLGEEFYQEAEPYLVFVSGKLCISKRASVIMALFADRVLWYPYPVFWFDGIPGLQNPDIAQIFQRNSGTYR